MHCWKHITRPFFVLLSWSCRICLFLFFFFVWTSKYKNEHVHIFFNHRKLLYMKSRIIFFIELGCAKKVVAYNDKNWIKIYFHFLLMWWPVGHHTFLWTNVNKPCDLLVSNINCLVYIFMVPFSSWMKWNYLELNQ